MKKSKSVDVMVSYINGKYTDDSFEYRSVTGGSLGSDTVTILVESAKYPGRPIHVFYTQRDGAESFSDNYLAVKYEDETLEYLRGAIREEFGDNLYLEYSASSHSRIENGSSETAFFEFIAEESADVFFKAVVYCTEENEDVLFEKVKAALSETASYGYIYFVNETLELSGEEGQGAAMEIIEGKRYTKRIEFAKSSVSEFKKVLWKDGV